MPAGSKIVDLRLGPDHAERAQRLSSSSPTTAAIPTLVNAGLLTQDTLGSGAAAALGVERAAPRQRRARNAPVDQHGRSTARPRSAASPTRARRPIGVTASGTHTVTVSRELRPARRCSPASQTFPPGGASTFVALGPPGSVIAVTLQDINFLPTTPGNARVRVVNAESGGTGVNTFVNGSLAVGALPAGQRVAVFRAAGRHLHVQVRRCDVVGTICSTYRASCSPRGTRTRCSSSARRGSSRTLLTQDR